MERRDAGRGAGGGAYARAARRLAWVFVLSFGPGYVGQGCSGEAGTARPVTPSTATSAAEASVVAPFAVEEIPGAAAPTSGDEVPEHIIALASRLEPRPLNIPRVRSGRARSFTFDGERKGWFARLPEGRQNLVTPTYGRGRVYLGGGFESHQVYALNAHTGRFDWIAAAEDGGPTAAILVEDKLLFNTESCTLFVVDADDGHLLWKRWLGDPLMSQPAAANGRVFSGHISDSGGYRFTALDLATGRPQWSRRITADVMNAAVLDDESVYFTTMDGVVWRLEQETGRVTWRKRLRATSAPWLDGDQLHVARRHRGEVDGRRQRMERNVVLGKADGETQREDAPVEARFVRGRPDAAGVPAGWGYEGSRPTIVDGRSYQTIGDEVHARDARSGELLWRRQYTRRVRRRPATPPAVAGGQLVFGTRDGELFGLDIDTGLTAWAYDVGEPITSQPTVAGGWVYASTTRGGVVGIEVGDRSLDGWHMWGGNAAHNGAVEGGGAASADRADDTDDDAPRPTEGALLLRGDAREGELAGFPLSGTRVDARVTGFVARVEVEQTFENTFERPVEAVYLFPLPDDAAVDAMQLRVGDRVVRGQIRERAEARREYRSARRRGVLASLLEQERPNLFRQSVANIAPGQAVSVMLSYTQVLPYEEGSYRFVYPMVAGPRYTPPLSAGGEAAGEAGDEPEAGQEATPTAPIVRSEARRDRVDIHLRADLGVPVAEVASPTHDVDVARTDDRRVAVRVGAVAPDRDLDVRFRVAGDAPAAGLLASAPTADDAGFVSLVVHPRLSVPDDEVMGRELVFVVDTSSSMAGRPLELAKAAMAHALEGARAQDTLRLVRFSDAASELSDEPLEATPENVERAKAWVRELRALGATEMKRGLSAALTPAVPDERVRLVVLFTDGYIGGEAEILREVDAELGQARLFPFGVGSAVNRFLLTRLAEVGRGDLQVVTPSESPVAAAEALERRIGRPYLTDVSIDWGGLPIHDVYPRRAPDLFADRPLVVHGRFSQGGTGTITLRGRIAGRPFEQEVPIELPGAESGQRRQELASTWARTRIRDLMTSMALRPSEALREEVQRLGLEHHLVTQWTSFVAVDERTRVDPASGSLRVHQASTLPSGADYGGVARRTARRSASSVSASSAGYVVSSDAYGAGLLMAQPSRSVVARAAAANVTGSLSREVVRRVISAQSNRIRSVYERRLRNDAELAGRLVVRFAIAANGTVQTATVASSTLGAPGLEQEILAVLRTLTFPATDSGGLVVVSYPFVFAPGD